MKKKHGIGWLNVPGYIPQTWNPIVGCSKISEGCRNCYAERMAKRQRAMGTRGYTDVTDETGRFTGQTVMVNSELEKPLNWRSPRAIFVNSMGDLFHENTPDWMIDEVFAVILGCQIFDNYDHRFIVLTKRAERMAKYFSADPVELLCRWARAGSWMVTRDEEENLHSWVSYDPAGYAVENIPLPNVWLGVTAENQSAADERIPHLLSTPAAVRFVSVEPMIGPVWLRDFSPFCATAHMTFPGNAHRVFGGIDWIICGGESGPGARPMNPEWAMSLRDQAKSAGVPFFFKQWGDTKFTYAVSDYACYQKSEPRGGGFLDGRKWLEWPNGGAQ